MGRIIHIENPAAAIAMKMKMFPHIRAIAHCHPIQIDQAHQPAPYERVQAIIDRGHGNDGHGPLGPHENFLRRRVIALPQQHIINMLPLRRQAKAARRQSFAEPIVKLDALTFHSFQYRTATLNNQYLE